MIAQALVPLVAAVMVFVAFGATSAEGEQDMPSEGVVIFGEAPPDHEGELQWFECEAEPQLATGVMSDIPGCGDYGGEHVRGYEGDYHMAFGFRIHETGTAGPIPLTGPLEAVLKWDGGISVLRCHWQAGEFQQCNIPNIQRPPPGATFTFNCTSVQAAIGHGTIGHWGECFLVHS